MTVIGAQRLDWLVTEERRTAPPADFGADQVFHYSIPTLDEIGDGRMESTGDIGSAKLILSGGEVLISKLNPRIPRVLRAVPHEVPTVASTEFIALRPGPDADARFLAYWLASEHLRQYLDGATMSVTRSQQRVRPDVLAKLWVNFPPVVQQRAVADYLDTETARIDALVERKSEQLRLVRIRLQVTAHAATEGSPKTPLRRFVKSVRTGTTPPTDVIGHLQRDGDLAWLSPGDVDDALALKPPARQLQSRAVADGYCPAFPADSTLIVGIGATAGRVAHLPYPATGNQQMTCLQTSPTLVPKFLSWSLWARQDQMRATAPYTTLPIISNDFIRSFPIWCPSIPDQLRIASELDSLAATIGLVHDRLVRQIALLREHRQALITEVVTGGLNIPGVAS